MPSQQSIVLIILPFSYKSLGCFADLLWLLLKIYVTNEGLGKATLCTWPWWDLRIHKETLNVKWLNEHILF
ncbi:hypothetical protein V8C40DRAFT_244672 [Trichoderma camerunense]